MAHDPRREMALADKDHKITEARAQQRCLLAYGPVILIAPMLNTIGEHARGCGQDNWTGQTFRYDRSAH